MDDSSKREWLETNGILKTPVYKVNTDYYSATWRAHGGFITVSYGDTPELACSHLYDNVEDDLFGWCDEQDG